MDAEFGAYNKAQSAPPPLCSLTCPSELESVASTFGNPHSGHPDTMSKMARNEMDADISVQASTQPIDENFELEVSFNPKPSLVLRISAIVVPLMTFCVQNWFAITVALLGSGIQRVALATGCQCCAATRGHTQNDR